MIVISSLCIPLAERIRWIDGELAKCTDEANRTSLLAEREIKGSLLGALLDKAYPVPRKKQKPRN